MGFISDLKGTLNTFFQIAKNGVLLRNNSGNLIIRNSDDTLDAELTASQVNISGNGIVVNSDAIESGSDYKITLIRPTSGMTASYELTFPVNDGSPSQVLTTNGGGGLSWESAGSTNSCLKFDTTTIGFGSSSSVSMFTLPANAVVHLARVIVDTAFDGSPSLGIGISGAVSKYANTTQINLMTADVFDITPVQVPVGTTEALIATYSAGEASQGSARILIGYYIPD
jgi:hypothetical protein